MFWTSFLWRSASKERPRDSTTEENEYLETELNNILRGQNNNNNNNNQLGFEKTNGSGWYLRKHFYFIFGFWFPTNMSVSVNLWGINSSQQSLFNFFCICASVFSFLMLVVLVVVLMVILVLVVVVVLLLLLVKHQSSSRPTVSPQVMWHHEHRALVVVAPKKKNKIKKLMSILGR